MLLYQIGMPCLLHDFRCSRCGAEYQETHAVVVAYDEYVDDVIHFTAAADVSCSR